MTNEDWNNINKIASQIKDVFTHYTPQAWEIVKQIKQIDSFYYLLIALIFTVVPLVALFFVPKLFKKLEGFCDREAKWFIIIMYTSFVFFIFAVNVTDLLNLWEWVGAFNPQLAIAHDLVEKVLSH